MGLSVFRKGESGLKVLSQQFSLLNNGEEGGVDFSLGLLSVGNALLFFFGFFLGGSGSEESVLTLLGSLGLYSLEEVVVDLFGFSTADINLSGGGDDSALVNSSKRNTVELIRSSDQKKSGLKLLKEDDSLSLESTDQKDQNLAWGDVLSESNRLGGLSGTLTDLLLVVSRVPLGDSGGGNLSSLNSAALNR